MNYNITQKELHDLFEYEKDGSLIWRIKKQGISGGKIKRFKNFRYGR